MQANDVLLTGLRARSLAIPLEAAKRKELQDDFATRDRGGMHIVLEDDHLAHIFIPEVLPSHRGGLGSATTVNGVIIAGMFDSALGIAGLMHFLGKRAGTCELSMKFMRPAMGDRIDVWSSTIRRGASLAFVEAELYAGGKLCSICTGIVAVSGSQTAA
jgi:acyl-coenzyme A thioesterase PaaI-like protein